MALRLLSLLCLTVVAAPFSQGQAPQSVYTELSGRRCRTLKADNSGDGSWLGECAGLAGYKLQLEEGDLRQNMIVVTPRGKRHSLNLWSVVGSGFSSVGKQAEWRLRKQGGASVPVALIVRYNVSVDPVNSTKTKSFLAVSKITPTEICVTHKIEPGNNANEEARKAADSAASAPCLK